MNSLASGFLKVLSKVSPTNGTKDSHSPNSSESGKSSHSRNRRSKNGRRIGRPENVQHKIHVVYNSETGKIDGLPAEWQTMIDSADITQKEQQENSAILLEALKFYHRSLHNDDVKYMSLVASQCNLLSQANSANHLDKSNEDLQQVSSGSATNLYDRSSGSSESSSRLDISSTFLTTVVPSPQKQHQEFFAHQQIKVTIPLENVAAQDSKDFNHPNNWNHEKRISDGPKFAFGLPDEESELQSSKVSSVSCGNSKNQLLSVDTSYETNQGAAVNKPIPSPRSRSKHKILKEIVADSVEQDCPVDILSLIM